MRRNGSLPASLSIVLCCSHMVVAPKSLLGSGISAVAALRVEYIGHRMAFDGFQESGLGDVSRLKHSSLEERCHLRHGGG